MPNSTDDTRTSTVMAPPPGAGAPPTTVGTATPPPPGGRRIPVWVIVVVATLVLALAATGILLWRRAAAADQRAARTAELLARLRQGGTPSGTATITPSSGSGIATPTPSATATEPPAVEPPAPVNDLPYRPGPNETGQYYGYIRGLTVDKGYVYATVDYVLIGEGPDGWYITNDNPKLRTFPLAATAPCRALEEGTSDLGPAMSPLAFRAIWSASPPKRMIRRNPYRITVKKGVITKLENEWLP